MKKRNSDEGGDGNEETKRNNKGERSRESKQKAQGREGKECRLVVVFVCSRWLKCDFLIKWTQQLTPGFEQPALAFVSLRIRSPHFDINDTCCSGTHADDVERTKRNKGAKSRTETHPCPQQQVSGSGHFPQHP